MYCRCGHFPQPRNELRFIRVRSESAKSSHQIVPADAAHVRIICFRINTIDVSLGYALNPPSRLLVYAAVVHVYVASKIAISIIVGAGME